MGRCGVSWVGSVIQEVYKRLYGKELEIIYEKNRAKVSNTLVEGWTGVYDIDPQVLLDLGYDKVILIKRDLETIKREHARYRHLEQYESYEGMKEKRPGFFKRIELTYNLLYNQDIGDERLFTVHLRDLNRYTSAIFSELIEFLEFKLTFIQKVKLFFRIVRNKAVPFVVPTNPPERDWDIYSAMLDKGAPLCKRLQFMKKLYITT